MGAALLTQPENVYKVSSTVQTDNILDRVNYVRSKAPCVVYYWMMTWEVLEKFIADELRSQPIE